MIVRGRDFDEIYDLVGIRVLVNSVRDCYAVLGVDPRAVDAAARPVQGLHRHAEVQPLPVAAHDRDRPEGPRRRDPDPHARHAPARRVRCRRALEVQGADELRSQRPDAASAHDTDMAWLAHISDWQAETADPGEFLDSLRFEIGAKEVYVFTPKGRVIGLPVGCDPGRLRLRRAHRGRPPHDGREGQRPPGAARERAVQRRRGRGVHVEEPRLRSEQGLAHVRQEPPRAEQDPPVVHQGAPRRGDRAGPRRHRPRDAQAEPAAAEAHEPGVVRRGRRAAALRRRLGAVRRGRRGSRLDPVGAREGRRARPRRRRGRRARPADPGALAPAAAELRLRRARARGARHPRQARPVLHPGARRRDRRLHHPRCRASRCTRRTATTCSR